MGAEEPRTRATLATQSDLAAWLDTEFERQEQVVVDKMLAAVEAALEHETGATFQKAGTVTDEPHNGRGRPSVRVDRPVDDLRATGSVLKVGENPAAAELTVDLTDHQHATLDPENPQRIVLRQYRLPKGTGNVHVTYEAAAYLPEVARLAVVEMGAKLLNERGLSGLQGADLGRMFSFQLQATAAEDEELEWWTRAVESCLVPVLG